MKHLSKKIIIVCFSFFIQDKLKMFLNFAEVALVLNYLSEEKNKVRHYVGILKFQI